MDEVLTRTLELVKRAQAGSDEALSSLFQRYYERVRRIVRIRLGSRLRSRMESGDILQDTFMSALGSFDHFEMRDEASFIQWLSRIAENQIRDAADYVKAAKRDVAREVPLAGTGPDSDESMGIDPVASGMLPADALSIGEQTLVVEQCLEQLSDEYRELVVLRDYVGMSWDQIAEVTGRPSPDAARMKHATAMASLARLVVTAGKKQS